MAETPVERSPYQRICGIYKELLVEQSVDPVERWYNEDANGAQRQVMKKVMRAIYASKPTAVLEKHPLYKQAKVSVDIYANGVLKEEFMAGAVAWLCRNPGKHEQFESLFNSLGSSRQRTNTTYQSHFPGHKAAHVHLTTPPSDQSPLSSALRLERTKKLTFPKRLKDKMEDKYTSDDAMKALSLLQTHEKAVDINQRTVHKEFSAPWPCLEGWTKHHNTEFKESFCNKPLDKTIHVRPHHLQCFQTTASNNVLSSHAWSPGESYLKSIVVSEPSPTAPKRSNNEKGQAVDLSFCTTYQYSYPITEGRDALLNKRERITKVKAKTPWDCQAVGFTIGSLQSTTHEDFKRAIKH